MLRQLLHDWLGSGIWFVHRADDPPVYNALLVVLALTAVLTTTHALIETRDDVRNGNEALISFLINLGFGVFVFGFIVLSLVVAWFGFATPLERLPLVPSTPFLNGVAIVMHEFLALFGIGVVVGVVCSFYSLQQNTRPYRACLLAIPILSTIGWEVSHFPASFLVPAELLLILGVGPTVIQVFFPSRVGSALLARVRNLTFAVLATGGVVAVWRRHHLPFPPPGLGPISSRQDPTLYRIMLVVCAISFGVAVFYLVVMPQSDRVIRTLFPAAATREITTISNLIVYEGIALYMIWLSLATPFNRLPFGPPIVTGSLLSTLAYGVYVGGAILVHGALSWAFMSLLSGMWLGQLGLNRTSRAMWLLQAGTLVVIAVSWEILHYPLWFLLPAETFIGLGVAVGVQRAIFGPRERFGLRTPSGYRRSQRLRAACFDAVVVATLLFIVLAHNIRVAWVTVGLLYVALAVLDGVFADTLFAVHTARGDYRIASPRRWLISAPVVLAIVLAAASGLFAPFVANTTLQPRVWIEAGAAAAAYMLFKPLTDLAQYLAGKRAEQPKEESLVAAVIDKLGALVERNSLITKDNVPVVKSTPAAVDGNGERNLPRESDRGVRTLIGAKVSEKLNFPTGAIFLVALLCYDYLIVSLHFSAILNSSLVPLVFSLTALVAGLLPLFTKPELESPRSISLLLLFVIIVVTGANLLFTVNPMAQVAKPLTGSPLALLREPRFYSMTMRLELQAFLFLLTIGQLSYLYKVIATTINLDIEAIGDMEKQGWDELADELYDQDRYEAAISAYLRAIEDARDDARLWRSLGVSYEFLHRYPQALDAYEQALRLKPGSYRYLVDKGDALRGIGKRSDALAAYGAAIALNSRSADAWNGKGNVLDEMGRFAEAIEAYEQSTHYAPRSAVLWRNMGNTYLKMGDHAVSALTAFEKAIKLDGKSASAWYGKGRALAALKRHEEAVTAYDRAVALVPDNAMYLSSRGNALRELGRYSESMETYKQAMIADPRYGPAWHGMAHTLLVMKDYPGALGAIQRAITLDPTDGNLWDSKGEILANMERYDEALIAFDQAIALAPEPTSFWVPTSWRSKAKILNAQGRLMEAREAEAHARGKLQDPRS